MWDLIDLVLSAIFDTAVDYEYTYHRDKEAFAIGCLMKVGLAVLGLLTLICLLGGVGFLAWFFGIPAAILLVVLLKYEWDCYREG